MLAKIRFLLIKSKIPKGKTSPEALYASPFASLIVNHSSLIGNAWMASRRSRLPVQKTGTHALLHPNWHLCGTRRIRPRASPTFSLPNTPLSAYPSKTPRPSAGRLQPPLPIPVRPSMLPGTVRCPAPLPAAGAASGHSNRLWQLTQRHPSFPAPVSDMTQWDCHAATATEKPTTQSDRTQPAIRSKSETV